MSNDKIIEKGILLHAPIDQVWKAWTTEDGLKSFFAPDCKLELAPCGKFELYFMMDNPEGSRGSETCIVLSFIKNDLFSFTWNAPPQFPEVRKGPKTMVVLNFHELANGSSHLKLRHVGWHDGEEWDAVYQYFDKAWTHVLNSLKKTFDTLTIP